MAGYTRQQLIAAKAGVVGVTSFAAGWYLGRDEGDYAVSILVAAAIFGTMAGTYELMSAWLASWFGNAARPESGEPHAPSELPPPIQPPEFANPSPPLRLRDGVKVLAAFLTAQLAVWVVAVLFAVLPLEPGDPGVAVTAGILRVFPVALPVSMIASALSVLLLARRFSSRAGAQPARLAFGLRGVSRRWLLLAAGAGALLATLLGIVSMVVPAPDPHEQSLLAQALASGPLGRIVFALTAVLIAPPVEEYVFRGVLLGTLLPAIGPSGAAALSGIAFWMLHATEWIHYWPAALGVGAMTLLVTALRMRTGSIVPSIGAHMFYNAALTCMALLG